MRSLAVRVFAATAAAALLLGLTGCGGGSEEPAATASKTAASTPKPTPTPTPEPVPAAYTLTQDQINAAVLTTADYPQFVDDPDALLDSGDDGSTYDPAACKDVFDGLEVVAGDQTPTAVAHVGLSSDDVAFIGQDISSYAAPFAATWVDDFAAQVATCPTFTLAFPDGSQAQGTLSMLELPAYGDKSTQVRASIDVGGGTVLTQDLILVTIGQVQVALGIGGLEAADATTEDQIITGALASFRRPRDHPSRVTTVVGGSGSVDAA